MLFCIYLPIHVVLWMVVERGELDHDGCHHGRHQLSGLYHCAFFTHDSLCFVTLGTHPNDHL